MTSLSTHDMVWPEQWGEYPRHTEDVSSRMPGGAERSGTDHAQHHISSVSGTIRGWGNEGDIAIDRKTAELT